MSCKPSSAQERVARPLGALSLLLLGVNGIVGVGIFFVPSEVARVLPGAAGVWAYAVTALCLLPVAFCFALLGAHFDENGGPYVWARAAFGASAGFAVGWVAYVSAGFSTAAVVAGLSRHVGPDFGLESELSQRLLAAVCLLGLAFVASAGLRLSSLVWSGLTILKLVPLALLVGAFALGHKDLSLQSSAPVERSWFRAALVVTFALQGFEVVPVVAHNAKNFARSIPLATVGSLTLAALLYTGLQAACVSGVPGLSQSSAPLVDAARSHGGAVLTALVAQGANVSALGIAFGMIAITPRYLSVLGRPDALGAWLGREDVRRVPRVALVITAALGIVLVLAGSMGELFALASIAVLTQYAVSLAALSRLAISGRRGLRPLYALPVPFGLVAIVLVVQAATKQELLVAGATLGLGVGVLKWRHGRLKSS